MKSALSVTTEVKAVIEVANEMKFVREIPKEIQSVMRVTTEMRSVLQIEIENEICGISCSSNQNEIFNGSSNRSGRSKSAIKPVIKVPAELICEESSNCKEIPVTSRKYV